MAQSCLKRFVDMVSAFENGRAGQDRPQWAQISRDLSWPKAEWQLSGDKKRKRTFDSHECRTSKFDSSLAFGKRCRVASRTWRPTSVDWRLARTNTRCRLSLVSFNWEADHAYDHEKTPAAQGNAGSRYRVGEEKPDANLEKVKGIQGLLAVAFDDGSIGSINVFESEDAANNANQQVRKEVGNSASDMLQHVETKVWRILYEDHPRRSTDT
jgi:hypothetical protein